MSVGHKSYCNYPSDPCCCERDQEEQAQSHKPWCGYPSDPCDCGMEERAGKFERTFGREPKRRRGR